MHEKAREQHGSKRSLKRSKPSFDFDPGFTDEPRTPSPVGNPEPITQPIRHPSTPELPTIPTSIYIDSDITRTAIDGFLANPAGYVREQMDHDESHNNGVLGKMIEQELARKKSMGIDPVEHIYRAGVAVYWGALREQRKHEGERPPRLSNQALRDLDIVRRSMNDRVRNMPIVMFGRQMGFSVGIRPLVTRGIDGIQKTAFEAGVWDTNFVTQDSMKPRGK